MKQVHIWHRMLNNWKALFLWPDHLQIIIPNKIHSLSFILAHTHNITTALSSASLIPFSYCIKIFILQTEIVQIMTMLHPSMAGSQQRKISHGSFKKNPLFATYTEMFLLHIYHRVRGLAQSSTVVSIF